MRSPLRTRTVRDRATGESLVTVPLPRGGTLLVMPRPGFRETHAMVAVEFGSADVAYRRPGEGSWSRLPAGTAHFLEHQLFEGEHINAFHRFSRLGASANAFTDYNMTAYYASCTARVTETFRQLLDFVRKPHFTPETVRKECGIIAQEIRMYRDDPNSRLHENLLQALFHRHPVREDIAGTVESIRRIRSETLYDAYEAFYRPSQVVVVVVGPVRPARVAEAARDALADWPTRAAARIERRPPGEPIRPRVRIRTSRMPVEISRILLGWKDAHPPGGGRGLLVRRIRIGLALSHLFGRASPLYERLYVEGLIDEDFGSGYDAYRDWGCVVAGGRTRDPRRFRKRLTEELQGEIDRGIPAAAWERVRRKAIGSYFRNFNGSSSLPSLLATCRFLGMSVFDYLPILERTSRAAVERTMRELFRPDRMAEARILPR